MFTGFNENIETEVIVLSDLKHLDYNTDQNRNYGMNYLQQKEYPNKSKEEIEKSVKETKEKFYRINNEKTIELEQKFKQAKLIINFDCSPQILRDGNFYTISKGCFTVYDDRIFKKLYEIKLEVYSVSSVIQLDNKDLVFLSR